MGRPSARLVLCAGALAWTAGLPAIAEPAQPSGGPSAPAAQAWRRYDDALRRLKPEDLAALRLAIEDMRGTFGDRYRSGTAFLERLAALEKEIGAVPDFWERVRQARERQAQAAQAAVVRTPAPVPITAVRILPDESRIARTAATTGLEDEIDALVSAEAKKSAAPSKAPPPPPPPPEPPRPKPAPETPRLGDPWDRLLAELAALQAEALLANPLLDFDRMLLVRRRVPRSNVNNPRALGLPQNWQGNCVLPSSGYDNEIAALSPVAPWGELRTVYRPDRPVFVGDVDLHAGGERMLFSSIGTNGRWQIFEIGADGGNLRQVTRGEEPDVDHYDACYLPSDRIVFGSTASFQGVPCVGGGNQVANLYVMDSDGGNVRQLCFDQDHSWSPAVMNDGRVMFTRWEYSDTPHYFTRIVMAMNPDGTGQTALYGSNSYWPNSVFYARPVPGHPSQFIGIVSGHHGVARMGELVLFDPALGQHEADGAIQRIPGRGKRVEPVIRDALVDGSWPKFLHPYPLGGTESGQYFLASCRPSPQDEWGIYLADTFDNLVPLAGEADMALLEPVPLRRTARPPVIPSRVNPRSKNAMVYLTDVYLGGGLAGVPRGTVKALRLFAFDYGYRGLADHTYIGCDGPWDVHRILGTVPVASDGSAVFRVPANVPISVQPLDARGQAVQIMRSWFTAMPGENLACVGCHERSTEVTPSATMNAVRRPPAEIRPWYGPARGFGFEREVQPVLDRLCVGCHHDPNRPKQTPGPPDLRPERGGPRGFSAAYSTLHRYVLRPSPESDYHLLPPGEYHAEASELIQMLDKGHHGVRLDAEARDRFVTWIDLNVPFFGTWGEFRAIPGDQRNRRCELRRRYAGVDADYEDVPPVACTSTGRVEILSARPGPEAAAPACFGWPLGPTAARERQAQGGAAERQIRLGTDAAGSPVLLTLVFVPAGEFVMGDAAGFADERPLARVRIDRPFWIGKYEISNEQFSMLDPRHDSRYFNRAGKDQSDRGVPMNGPGQPVVRVSWERAMAFCRRLSERTGRTFMLPTEAEWEYACRAGTATPFHFGGQDSDLPAFANVADATLAGFHGSAGPAWRPADARFNDRCLVTSNVSDRDPNAWGLHNMHGNAAEWTRSAYRPYPYNPADGRDDPADAGERRVVRGGSFYDRPVRCRSGFRLSYVPWLGVFNVGFRVVMAHDAAAAAPAPAAARVAGATPIESQQGRSSR